MTTPQLIALRYSELVAAGDIDAAVGYLDDQVIYNTWMGVAEGKANVVNFLRDNIRFLHHNYSYNRWKQVQHTLDASPPSSTSDGYDSVGYATFERDGKISTRAKFSYWSEHVKETLVVRNGLICLVSISKKL